jgi:glutathione S-transferase
MLRAIQEHAQSLNGWVPGAQVEARESVRPTDEFGLLPASVPRRRYPMLEFYFHPLASYCHKVLIALFENDTPFEGRIVDLLDDESRAAFQAMWPVGKMPVLRDGARTVAESSIIVEYLDQFHRGAAALVPADPQRALDVRLWDRFFDLYVHAPLQKIVGDRIRAEAHRDPHGVDEARRQLESAYRFLDERLPEPWAAGATFSLADCAAAPPLFYLQAVQPFDAHSRLAAYFHRLCERPSVRRTIDQARPYMHMFPFASDLPARFRP